VLFGVSNIEYKGIGIEVPYGFLVKHPVQIGMVLGGVVHQILAVFPFHIFLGIGKQPLLGLFAQIGKIQINHNIPILILAW
tara:strand:- start:17073 stop:17315 length:243 start_codon:yes stop_codon:yes gene_type:complete